MALAPDHPAYIALTRALADFESLEREARDLPVRTRLAALDEDTRQLARLVARATVLPAIVAAARERAAEARVALERATIAAVDRQLADLSAVQNPKGREREELLARASALWEELLALGMRRRALGYDRDAAERRLRAAQDTLAATRLPVAPFAG